METPVGTGSWVPKVYRDGAILTACQRTGGMSSSSFSFSFIVVKQMHLGEENKVLKLLQNSDTGTSPIDTGTTVMSNMDIWTPAQSPVKGTAYIMWSLYLVLFPHGLL